MFEIKSSKKIFHANQLKTIYDGHEQNSYPYVVRMTKNNGVRGFIKKDIKYLNEANTISFAQDTFSVFYQKQPFFTGNKIKILKPKFVDTKERIMQYLTASFQKSLSKSSWGEGSTVSTIMETKIQLPIKNEAIDFAFMEQFIAELEAEHLAELEAYLLAAELNDYQLTNEEQLALKQFESLNWNDFNLKTLFGKSTRGRRLKSLDRIEGNLPFVTAGEADEGVSAYIGNDVIVFSKNTTTIDMFGSAKYRNYKYGADDHIAVVHTENISKYAAIFTTSAIHKSSYTDKFSYARNFYAKDADELNIKLPTKNNQPDYQFMELFISAIQKLVIKDVVIYADKKMQATRNTIRAI